MMKSYYLAALASAFAFFGCADEALTAPGSAVSPGPGQVRTLGGVGAPEGSLEDRGRALAFGSLDVMRVADEAESWQALDAEYRSMFMQAEPLERWALQQAAAFEMLDRHLLAGTSTPGKAATVAHYLPFILDAESPDVGVVAEALDLHAAHLGRARVQEWARQAARVGRSHLAESAGERRAPEDARLGDAEAQLDARDARLARDLQRLERLAR